MVDMIIWLGGFYIDVKFDDVISVQAMFRKHVSASETTFHIRLDISNYMLILMTPFPF